MTRANRSLSLVLGLAVVLALGCSSIPKADAMQPRDLSFGTQQPGSIVVQVSGGQDFAARVSDAAFEEALRNAMIDSGLFAAISEGDPAYRLDVVLGDGHGLEGRELTLLWSLSRTDNGRTFWQKLITSRGRSYHFVGVTRQRRGIEFAARENIRLGLEQLAGLDFEEAAARVSDAAASSLAP